MKYFNKIAVTLLTFIILTLGTTGCWNRRELPSLAIVLGVGIDKSENTDKKQIEVTAQIIKTSELKTSAPEDSSTGESGSTGAYSNVRNRGETMFATIRDFTHKVSRKLYFPHNQVIIFGRSLAEQGIRSYLDFFFRDQETRFEVLILVADDKARDVFDVRPRLEKVPAMEIAELMDAQAANSMTSVVRLNQLGNRLMSETTAPIAPIIEILGKGEEKEISVKGTAVFKQDKLIGQMNKEETRGLLWAIDEIKSGIIDVYCPEMKNFVSLEIIRAQSKISAEIIDDKPCFKIEVKEEGNIASQCGMKNLTAPNPVSELERLKSEVIEAEIKSALSKAQKLNADIFGFGDVLHRNYPKEWQELKKSWDEIFPDLEVEVVAEAKLRRSGSIGRPVAPAKEQ
ncbi:Ger(x)C family spore germination protein [Desulfosporosinus youngiae]|uniref:Germination protein, Ger(X)C family n=1 Tax=Desulfosporosinus youngiae DSM 17734 TaxID=768710 RepID=H5Y2W5_9FIRM|nr:Ger(x)C family spore germination protein [Desulfosporosinus youngiae]EHQ88522.1 germination protein, Ger(X)C family [Desulfosporosinus youngiae DSM 17734]